MPSCCEGRAVTMLSDDLKALVGRELNYPSREPIGRASIRYFALALGDDNPLYCDQTAARAAGYRDVVAPPTFVVESCQYAHRVPDADGYIGHEWRLPVKNCRLIRAGNEYEFMQPVHPDDEISVTFKLTRMEERSRSGGGSQLFVTSLGTYTNQRGEVLAKNTEVTVIQPLVSASEGGQA